MDVPLENDPLAPVLDKDPRYNREAYLFIREALEFTQRHVRRENGDNTNHITGRELLDGIREFALKQYGPMTSLVLEEWGVRRCEDFGEIVFNMVEHKILSKTDKDSREDFKDGYDFIDAFRTPFLPKRGGTGKGAN
jgi:uncharacterized repeat protein (TIGR04138 family)